MADEVAQVVECLPSKSEALSSNPSTQKSRSTSKEHKGIFGDGENAPILIVVMTVCISKLINLDI
jgi:hypothetical protein